MRLLLDTGVLGQVCHPRKHGDARAWLRRVVHVHELIVPEIADYELRRELMRIGAARSLAHLDELGRCLSYQPVTTATWRRAAGLWAQLRRAGRPTADGAALDGDMLLAALALEIGASVVTTNPRHFDGLVEAMSWGDVPSAS